jgi:large subunit ribosomal protein L9
MDVILLERVEKLGHIGDVVTVKNGFARNFLLPRNKALRSNEANRKIFEARKDAIVADNAARKVEAEAQAVKIAGAELVLIRQSSNTGQLYGSVAVRDIIEALQEQGHHVARQAIDLTKPIKTIGVFAVKLVLHPEVNVNISVNVARSPEEAALQAKGVDVASTMMDREQDGFTEAYDPNMEPGQILETLQQD